MSQKNFRTKVVEWLKWVRIIPPTNEPSAQEARGKTAETDERSQMACPHCGKRFSYRSKAGGTPTACPYCNQAVMLNKSLEQLQKKQELVQAGKLFGAGCGMMGIGCAMIVFGILVILILTFILSS